MIVTDICAVMDSNGVDVYFLNRDPALNVTNPQNMRHVFNSPPQGLTPLVPALRRVLAAKRNQTFEKKLLILVATDGYVIRLIHLTNFVYFLANVVHRPMNKGK